MTGYIAGLFYMKTAVNQAREWSLKRKAWKAGKEVSEWIEPYAAGDVGGKLGFVRPLE